MLEIVLLMVRKHLAYNEPSPFLLSIVEHAIETSEGKTPARYELLKLWKQMYETIQKRQATQ